MRPQIITVAAIKGGTGKTTTAAAIAQAAADDGKKVLAIDLDPQANLTDVLGAPIGAGSYEVIQHGQPIAECLTYSQNIAVVAGSANLATVKGGAGSASRLFEAMERFTLEDYDLVIIDTPPQMGELTFQALYASTGLVIPLEADRSSLQGLYQITDIARQMQEVRAGLKITGVVLTKYDPRPKINRYLRDVITEKCQELEIPYLMEIRAGVSVREAQAMQAPLFEYDRRSKPAQDYLELYRNVTEE